VVFFVFRCGFGVVFLFDFLLLVILCFLVLVWGWVGGLYLESPWPPFEGGIGSSFFFIYLYLFITLLFGLLFLFEGGIG
jgi:hypothetical protein